MAGWFWPDTAYGLPVFLLLTFLGAAAASATGRAIASVWSPLWRIVPAIIPLAAGVRFLHFALFQQKLLSLHYYLVTFAILLAVAWYSYQTTRAGQMAKQYPWAFSRSGWGWRAR